MPNRRERLNIGTTNRKQCAIQANAGYKTPHWLPFVEHNDKSGKFAQRSKRGYLPSKETIRKQNELNRKQNGSSNATRKKNTVVDEFFKVPLCVEEKRRILQVEEKSKIILTTLRRRALGKYGNSNIKEMFREYDSNHDGMVSLDELNGFLRKLHLHHDLPPEDAAVLFKCFNANDENEIDFTQFSKIFDPNIPEGQIFESQDGLSENKEPVPEPKPSISKQQLDTAIQVKKKLCIQLHTNQDNKMQRNSQGRRFILRDFHAFDPNMENAIATYQEFKDGLGPSGLKMHFSDEEVMMFIKYCDKNNTGFISAKQFIDTLQADDEKKISFSTESRVQEMNGLRARIEAPVPDFDALYTVPWPISNLTKYEEYNRPTTVPVASSAMELNAEQRPSTTPHKKKFNKNPGNCFVRKYPKALSASTCQLETRSNTAPFDKQRERRQRTNDSVPKRSGDLILRSIKTKSAVPITRRGKTPAHVVTNARVGFGTGGAMEGSSHFSTDENRYRTMYTEQYEVCSPSYERVREFTSKHEHIRRNRCSAQKQKNVKERKLRIYNVIKKEIVDQMRKDEMRIRVKARQKLNYLQLTSGEGTRKSTRRKEAEASWKPKILRSHIESKDSMFVRNKTF